MRRLWTVAVAVAVAVALGTTGLVAVGTASAMQPPGQSRSAAAVRAAGAVGIGSLVTNSPVLCGSAFSWVQTQSSTSYTVPFDGVITSFSHLANGAAGNLRLLAFRSLGGGYYEVVGKSPLQAVTPSAVNTFPARVPVPAGALLGLRTTSGGMWCGDDVGAENIVHYDNVDPDVSPTMVLSSPSHMRINLSALVEPDVDKDGYGDVSQDLCPQSATAQTACPAPETIIKKKPAKHSSLRKPKITFRSSMPGSTFTCRVDTKKSAKSCTSPFTKRFGYGKHTVTITAVSAAGIPDPTPVKLKFTIMRKHR